MVIVRGLSLLLNLLVQLPHDLSSEEVDALLEACSQAIEPNACVLRPEDAPADARIERIAPTRFSMEIALETNQQQRLISREFTFKPEDVPLERARALGLSLGLLARNAQGPEPTQEPPPELLATDEATLRPEQAISVPVSKREPAPPIQQTKETRRARWLSELQVGVGYETGLTTPLYQGDLRLGWRPVDAFSILLSFSLAGGHDADASAPLDMRQVGGWLGLGYFHRFAWGRVGVELEAGVRSTTFFSDSALDKVSRSTFVLRAHLPVHVAINRFLYVLIAPQAVLNSSPTTVYWNGERRAQTGYVVPAVNLGLGVGF